MGSRKPRARSPSSSPDPPAPPGRTTAQEHPCIALRPAASSCSAWPSWPSSPSWPPAAAATTTTSSSSTTAAKGERLRRRPRRRGCYVGPINDGGWTQAHDEGREAVEEELGDAVETTYKENVPEGPEAKQVIEDLIKDGNKIIFATSFGYGDALAELADEVPGREVRARHGRGHRREPGHLLRRLRGHDLPHRHRRRRGHPEGGTVGFVAPFPIPEVIRHINAFSSACSRVNPTATIKVVWTNTWFDPDGRAPGGGQPRRRRRRRLASGQDSPASGEAAKAAEPALRGLRLRPERELRRHLAHRLALQLGPVLHRARPGRGRRHLGDRRVLRRHRGRLRQPRPVRRPGRARRPRPSSRTQQAAIVDGAFYVFAGPLDGPGRRGARSPRARRSTLAEHPLHGLVRRGRRRRPRGLIRTASSPPCRDRHQSSRAPGDRPRRSPRPASPSASPAGWWPTRPSTSRSRAGEVHALLGENGAGKSTLSNVLHRALPARRGHHRGLTGEPVEFHSPARRHRGRHRHGPPALPPGRAVHRGRERRPRRARAGSAGGPPRQRVARARRALRPAGRPDGPHLAAVGRPAAAGRDPQGARRARPAS